MNQNIQNNNDEGFVKGMLIAAGLGAAGGIVGGALWFGLSFLGRLAFISGIIAGLGGGVGAMITGKNGLPIKFIISILLSLGLFGVGVYLGMGVDIYQGLEGSMPLDTCIRLIPGFFSEKDVASAFMTDAALGAVSYVIGLASGIVKFKDLL